MLVSLATPVALLAQPSLASPAGAVGQVSKPKPKVPSPAARHAELLASQEIRLLAADARARSVSVVGLRSEWQRVAICEVGGNWKMVGPVYSGIGFMNSTWNEYGGVVYAPRAGEASEDAQIVIGMRVTRDWVPDQDGCDPGGW